MTTAPLRLSHRLSARLAALLLTLSRLSAGRRTRSSDRARLLAERLDRADALRTSAERRRLWL
ncbi:hypothetical protein [Leifsonia sp. PS1209]|uniref:hypothetical protein n=1 Tax=Leifsonia sp. PS1209 TaxID=2724914 RepID=UPI001442B76B|nr:hypothetical protein [Leifsonia sp. PS1209]QIZ99927.1 hypothetical protein HF024_16385 [Leifsonia sp. PS1209]